MDVKSTFLNGYILEDVYIEQPPDFQNHKYPDHVFKLKKVLYGLKQAPKAWYNRFRKISCFKWFFSGKSGYYTFYQKIRVMTWLLFKYMWMI